MSNELRYFVEVIDNDGGFVLISEAKTNAAGMDILLQRFTGLGDADRRTFVEKLEAEGFNEHFHFFNDKHEYSVITRLVSVQQAAIFMPTVVEPKPFDFELRA